MNLQHRLYDVFSGTILILAAVMTVWLLVAI